MPFWCQFAFSLKANKKRQKGVEKWIWVGRPLRTWFPQKRCKHTSTWSSRVGLIPSQARTTGGWTARTGGINSVSHHLVAQPEKLFSRVLLSLQATVELLIYLQPLEYGTPGFIWATTKPVFRLCKPPSEKLPVAQVAFKTNRTDCNKVRSLRIKWIMRLEHPNHLCKDANDQKIKTAREQTGPEPGQIFHLTWSAALLKGAHLKLET